jgi:hypothetical protein
MMEKKPLVTLVILLLIFALVVPIFIFKATGLTMYELAWGAAIPQIRSYFELISFVTIAADGERLDKNCPPHLSPGMSGPAVVYFSTVETPTAFSTDLDGLPAQDGTLLFSREGTKYLYAGHYFRGATTGEKIKGIIGGSFAILGGGVVTFFCPYAAPVTLYGGYRGIQYAREQFAEKPIEVGARAWIEPAKEAFDILVPGFLTKVQGFSDIVVKDKDTASLLSKGSIAQVQASSLGKDFLRLLMEGTLEPTDIQKGWNFEVMPQLGWSWSIYGVFKVPVVFEFWAKENPAYVPYTAASVIIKVPKPLPLGVSTVNSLLPGEPKIKNFEIVGLYNGYPLLSSGVKDIIGVNRLQNLEVNLFSGVLARWREKIEQEWGITAPKVERAKPKAGFGPVMPKLEFKPNIDINIWERTVSVNPKIDFITVSDYFDYSIEENDITTEQSLTTLHIAVYIRPREYPFTHDGYNRIRIRFEIPIAWTAQVEFSRPDNTKLLRDARYWYDNVLRQKLGWSLEDIQERLKDVFQRIKSGLRASRIDTTALEAALKSWLDTIFKFPDIPPVPDAQGMLDNYRREFEENLRRLKQEYQEAMENLRRELEMKMVPREVMESALENERKKWEDKLAEQQRIFNARYSELENKLREMEEKARTVTNFLLDSSEQVQTAPLPSLKELWGKYGMPIREIGIPIAAQLPDWQRRWIEEVGFDDLLPTDIIFTLPEPIGTEIPEIVTYETKVPEYEEKTVNAKRSFTEPYERPYGISDYAKDAILMVTVILGSIGAGLLSLRLLRGRER